MVIFFWFKSIKDIKIAKQNQISLNWEIFKKLAAMNIGKIKMILFKLNELLDLHFIINNDPIISDKKKAK